MGNKDGERPERYEERAARNIVGTALGAPTERWDVGALEKAHDFWVLPTSGRQAVEVVQWADRDAIADEAARARFFSTSSSRVHDGLKETWSLLVDEDSAIWGQRREDGRRTRRGPYKLLRQALGPALLELEAMGVHRVDAHRDFSYPFAPAENPRHKLISLGVHQAETMPSTRSPEILLSALRGFTVPGDADMASLLTDFLTDAPQRDVLDKLARSGASRRHAFVWLHRSSLGPFLSLWRDGELPTTAPNLPAEVTTVWLGKIGDWRTAVCWDASTGWQRVEAPSLPSA
ncbi:hypothetical protein ACIG63_27395 [Streptomyces antimycoticus]|uniref:hypothetical protein n=1 Tax=Streptomyces antimycoticus TaxID=68175 RepID=UPI0037D5A446